MNLQKNETKKIQTPILEESTLLSAVASSKAECKNLAALRHN